MIEFAGKLTSAQVRQGTIDSCKNKRKREGESEGERVAMIYDLRMN